MLFVLTLWVLKQCEVAPRVFTRIKRPNYFSLSSWGRFSSTLVIFMALLLTLSNLSLPFLNVGTRTGRNIPGAAWQRAPNWCTMCHWGDQGRIKFWRIKGEYCLSHKLFCEFMQHSGIWEIKLTGCYGPDISMHFLIDCNHKEAQTHMGAFIFPLNWSKSGAMELHPSKPW